MNANTSMADRLKAVKLTEAQAEVIDALSRPDTSLERPPGRGGYVVLQCVEKPSATSRWGRYRCLVGGIREATVDKLEALGLIELRTLGRYYATDSHERDNGTVQWPDRNCRQSLLA